VGLDGAHVASVTGETLRPGTLDGGTGSQEHVRS